MNISKYCHISKFTAKIMEMLPFKQTNHVNEVLFYGCDDEEQRRKLGVDNLSRILYFIATARSTVDVCLPRLNSQFIAKTLIELDKNKVKVRIAIHDSSSSENLRELIQCGIEVKFVKAEKLEHNFIIIDAGVKGPVAILGSLEYETRKVIQNRDSTVITSDANAVKTLEREFQRVWKSIYRETKTHL